ncbi:MAG: hypothetical protein J5930_11400 [Treponema sp.]|jgi:hypothetical protein|nr:hypothetical protein [Treponema sp.]
MDDFKFKIEQSFGFISETKAGWKTELNLISWGDRPAKYDLRPWSPDHEKMGKGLTLTKDELVSLKNLLQSLDI